MQLQLLVQVFTDEPGALSAMSLAFAVVRLASTTCGHSTCPCSSWAAVDTPFATYVLVVLGVGAGACAGIRVCGVGVGVGGCCG